jgi:hypothetical protein
MNKLLFKNKQAYDIIKRYLCRANLFSKGLFMRNSINKIKIVICAATILSLCACSWESGESLYSLPELPLQYYDLQQEINLVLDEGATSIARLPDITGSLYSWSTLTTTGFRKLCLSSALMAKTLEDNIYTNLTAVRMMFT